jgi:hypothetical protein
MRRWLGHVHELGPIPVPLAVGRRFRRMLDMVYGGAWDVERRSFRRRYL